MTACAGCADAIPQDRARRDQLHAAARALVAAEDQRGQLSQGELAALARRLLDAAGAPATWRDWMMVIINSESWREDFAAIPVDKRLLLLPQCLRDPDCCPAQADAWGLLCQVCGRCPLGELKTWAEGLGYMVLISEGTASVLTLVQSGRIQGFAGASCLTTLRKVFPMMSLVALPALAVPLLGEGCRLTGLDIDRLRDYVVLGMEDEATVSGC